MPDRAGGLERPLTGLRAVSIIRPYPPVKWGATSRGTNVRQELAGVEKPGNCFCVDGSELFITTLPGFSLHSPQSG
jgi:hypothetical protein